MKRALIILLAIAAPLLAMAQPRYTVEKIPMCWTVSAVDSSVTKIILISSVSDQLITIGYYNAAGAEVTVSGGTLAYGYCGTGGGGGGGDDDWRWYVPGDDTYAQPLYRVGKTNIFVTNAADTTHGFRVDSTFQFRMDGGRDIFDWQVGGGTGYDFTPHAGLFYRAPGTFEQNGLGSGHNQITLGLDDSTILSRDRLGAIVFAGRNPAGTGGYRPGAMITAFADGDWYADSSATSINFYVTRPNQTTMNNVVTFERGGRVELDYYQTFEDGIPERMMGFTNLSDDMTVHTITGTPGANKVLGINEYNTAMIWKDPGDVVQAETRHIVYQPAHGFILPAHGFIPVYLDTITGWELALAADSLTLHDSYIVEVISVDTFVLQEAGILRVPAGHGLTPGSDYFLTDVGGIATTPGYHNDWLATVWDTITLALKATRPVLGAVPDTTVYLTDATVFSGDVSGVYNNLQLGTGVVGPSELAATSVTAGSYGSSTAIPVITVDADGRITAASTAAANGGSGAVNQVTYWSGTNTLAGDSDFQFDGQDAALGTSIILDERLNIRSRTNTSATFPLRLTNSAGNNMFVVRGDQNISFGGSFESGVNFTNGYNSYFTGRLTIAPTGYGNSYRLNVSGASNPGNGPLSRFGWVLGAVKTKGTNIQNLSSGGGGYSSYPSIMTIAGTNDVEFSALSTASNGHSCAILAGVGSLQETSGYEVSGIVSIATLRKTPDLNYNLTRRAFLGISENLLTTAESSDEDLAASTQTFITADFQTKVTQNFTNGSINMTAVRADANGVSTVGGANATNNIGLYASAQGGTASNWSIYSDEGQHWFEDEIRIGGTASAPTAHVDIDGSARFRAVSTPGSVEDGEIWTSSTQKALVSNQDGINQILASTIFTGTADATVSNTVTETSIIPTGVGTVTLPANFLVAGKTIKIDAWGIWEADTIPSTLELRVELGGTLLCTTGAQTMVTCEGGEWHMEAIVTCRTTGATGTTYSQGEVDFMSAFTTSVKHWMRRSATNTIDTTVSNLLDVTATHAAADPDNSITLTNITVTVLN